MIALKNHAELFANFKELIFSGITHHAVGFFTYVIAINFYTPFISLLKSCNTADNCCLAGAGLTEQ